MRDLRAQLASAPNWGPIEKRQFFYKAFEAANRNLAMFVNLVFELVLNSVFLLFGFC